MSFVKKAVVWLGLNEEYPADDRAIVEPPRPEREHRDDGPGRSAPARERSRTERWAAPPEGEEEAVTHGSSAIVATPLSSATPPVGEGTVRAVPIDTPTGHNLVGTVRAVSGPVTAKPRVVVPNSFNDAQEVADHYREKQPVIVNMQNAERDLARRLIDFSSGLCYGLGGQMERVADQVYLLTPADVEVADEDRTVY